MLYRKFWKEFSVNSKKPNFVWHIFYPLRKPAYGGQADDTRIPCCQGFTVVYNSVTRGRLKLTASLTFTALRFYYHNKLFPTIIRFRRYSLSLEDCRKINRKRRDKSCARLNNSYKLKAATSGLLCPRQQHTMHCKSWLKKMLGHFLS